MLYDSVSKNTGDVAIGLVMQDFLKDEGIDFEVLNPFSYDPNNYSQIVVGGGHLLRDPGDSFYDKFRVNGKHILNCIGTSAMKDLEYLNKYDLVSTRSTKEKKSLEKAGVKNVLLVPEITTRMKGEGYKNSSLGKKKTSVGIHLVPHTLAMCPGLEEVINEEINEKKILFPFTLYNKDKQFMETIAWDGDHVILDELSPRQLFDVIGQMKFVITSSLHATLFAYFQNVPFLTVYQEKTYNLLKDRGLDKWIFRDAKDFAQKLEKLRSEEIDFTALVKKDKKASDEYFKKLKEVLLQSPKIAESNRKNTTSSTTKLEQSEFDNYILQEVLAGRDQFIKAKNGEIEHLRNHIKETSLKREKEIVERDLRIGMLEGEMNAMRSSKFWKLREIYVKFDPRKIRNFLKKKL